MLASRPTFWSALCSCVAHIMIFGSAAALMVTGPAGTMRAMKVTLMEQARPLTVGDSGEAGARTPVSASMKELESTPRPQLRPRLKPVAKKPARPRVLAAPTPMDNPAPVASLVVPPAAPPVVAGSVSDLNGGTVAGSSEAGAGGNGDSVGAGVGEGNGTGGGGMSARPEYGVNPKPPYPLLARRLGAQGVVVLRVQVREDGSVAIVELARSSGFAVLDDSAVRTVRDSWRFIPAQLDGIPVASWVEVPIRFVLEDS